MTRKAYIESLGATCNNWLWSWSFVNHKQKFVIFGYSDRDRVDNGYIILSKEWEFSINKKNGVEKKKPAYAQALNHVNLVLNQNYGLTVFKLEYEDFVNEHGSVKIKSFEQKLVKKNLLKVDENWVAVDYIESYSQIAETYDENALLIEGAYSEIKINAYERNVIARNECVKFHGCKCSICEFDFEKTYGPIGAKYIHVHHLVPLSTIKKEYVVNPETDLIPVCANCHAMIHRHKNTLPVEELKKLLLKKKNER